MSSSNTQKEQSMKDRYGYITISQKNYDPKYKTGAELKIRKIVNDGKPEIQIGMEVWTVKGKDQRLYREHGYITLKDDQLAEIAELFKS